MYPPLNGKFIEWHPQFIGNFSHKISIYLGLKNVGLLVPILGVSFYFFGGLINSHP